MINSIKNHSPIASHQQIDALPRMHEMNVQSVSNERLHDAPQTHPTDNPSVIPDRHVLLSNVTEQLQNLKKPAEGWFFEKSLGPLESLSAEQLQGIAEILNDTTNVKNIMSFGARNGGFELAMQIRHDLDQISKPDQSLGNRLSKNYLDAVSLQNHRHTQLIKLEGIDLFKMQNPFWDIGYKNGIENADKMIFIITPEWLDSTFCKQEFDWLQQTNNKNIDVAFTYSHDADKQHPVMKEIRSFTENNNALSLDLEPPKQSHLNAVSIENSMPLNFKRSISANQFNQITQWLKNQ